MIDLVDILSADELESAKQRCLKLANDHELLKQEYLKKAGELGSKQSKLATKPNHLHQPIQASPGAVGGNGGTRSRAVMILIRPNTGECASYPTCAAACRAVGLEVGGDSARRVLIRNGYIVRPQAA